jgi:hypothetical protein
LSLSLCLGQEQSPPYHCPAFETSPDWPWCERESTRSWREPHAWPIRCAHRLRRDRPGCEGEFRGRPSRTSAQRLLRLFFSCGERPPPCRAARAERSPAWGAGSTARDLSLFPALSLRVQPNAGPGGWLEVGLLAHGCSALGSENWSPSCATRSISPSCPAKSKANSCPIVPMIWANV